jgi:hypothetical protein
LARPEDVGAGENSDETVGSFPSGRENVPVASEEGSTASDHSNPSFSTSVMVAETLAGAPPANISGGATRKPEMAGGLFGRGKGVGVGVATGVGRSPHSSSEMHACPRQAAMINAVLHLMPNLRATTCVLPCKRRIPGRRTATGC